MQMASLETAAESADFSDLSQLLSLNHPEDGLSVEAVSEGHRQAPPP